MRALHAFDTTDATPELDIISLVSSTLTTTGGRISVQVTDALGRPNQDTVLSFASTSGLFAGKALTPADAIGIFEYHTSAEDVLTAGEHEVTIQGSGATYRAAVQVKQHCVIDKLTWSSVKGKKHASPPNPLSDVVLTASDSVSVLLVVECDGESFRPSHGTVTLTTPTGLTRTFAAVPDGGRLSVKFIAASTVRDLLSPVRHHVLSRNSDQ